MPSLVDILSDTKLPVIAQYLIVGDLTGNFR